MQFEWRLSVAFAFALCGAMVAQIMESRAQETVAATDEEKPNKIAEDGTVDWPTFSGFRRYNSICHTCQGAVYGSQETRFNLSKTNRTKLTKNHLVKGSKEPDFTIVPQHL